MLYTGFNFLKGIDFFSSSNKYYSDYAHIQGLTVSNPVYVNGLSVGRVSEIKILNDTLRTVRIGFDIDKSVKLGENASVMISNLDLLGSKGLVLNPGDADKPLKEKSLIPGTMERGFADKLGDKAGPLLDNANQTITRANYFLNEDNLKAYSEIVQNINATSADLRKIVAANARTIEMTTKNVEALTRSLVETEQQLKTLLVKLNTSADSINSMQLASTVAKLNQSTEEVNILLHNINAGKGSVGQLMTNDSLYRNLNSTVRDLDLLLVNFKEKPGRYVHFSVFGKKQK